MIIKIKYKKIKKIFYFKQFNLDLYLINHFINIKQLKTL